MSYKYYPTQPNILSQEEVDKLLTTTDLRIVKPLSYAEKLKIREFEREIKKWERYVKEWEDSFSPEELINRTISIHIAKYSKETIGELVPWDEIYRGVKKENTFTVYSYIVWDFKLPEHFYFTNTEKAYLLEIDPLPLEHSVELISKGSPKEGLTLTWPVQKTVYRITRESIITPEIRKGSIGQSLQLLNTNEEIPQGILNDIAILYNLPLNLTKNRIAMFNELKKVAQINGEYWFKEEMENQIRNLLLSRYQNIPKQDYKLRKQLVLDMAEEYESQFKK